MMKNPAVSLCLLVAVSCAACATSASSPASGGSMASIRGVIEAYGSEPHLLLMIHAEDGKLYYPEGELQRRLVGLPAAVYIWTGTLFPPRPALPGLIPEHSGRFIDLEWIRVD